MGEESEKAAGGAEKELEVAKEAEEEERFVEPHVAELRRRPKDPRSAARWNIISRLLFM